MSPDDDVLDLDAAPPPALPRAWSRRAVGITVGILALVVAVIIGVIAWPRPQPEVEIVGLYTAPTIAWQLEVPSDHGEAIGDDGVVVHVGGDAVFSVLDDVLLLPSAGEHHHSYALRMSDGRPLEWMGSHPDLGRGFAVWEDLAITGDQSGVVARDLVMGEEKWRAPGPSSPSSTVARAGSAGVSTPVLRRSTRGSGRANSS